jgi:hypothetical protein
MPLQPNAEFALRVGQYLESLLQAHKVTTHITTETAVLLKNSSDAAVANTAAVACPAADKYNKTNDKNDDNDNDDYDPNNGIWVTNHDETTDGDVCEETRQRLKAQDSGKGINDHWRMQYSTKAGSYWHKFYKRHTDKFFKNRHYLHLVFPDLLKGSTAEPCEQERVNLLEVGCGVGSYTFSLFC